MNRLIGCVVPLLVVGSACGVGDVVTVGPGAPSGYTFTHQGLTPAAEGDVFFEVGGCRGVYSGAVVAGPGVTLRTSDDASLHSAVTIARSTWPGGTNRELSVTAWRNGELIGKVRAVSATTSTSGFSFSVESEPVLPKR